LLFLGFQIDVDLPYRVKGTERPLLQQLIDFFLLVT
jgi:hypothetical protein